jgi:hypothetical protein
MTVTAPTRITIEVHPPTGASDEAPIVRVIPEHGTAAQPAFGALAGEPREDQPVPAPYDPGECHCLDDEDCGADHAND